METKIIILGAGGHAKVAIDTVQSMGKKIHGIIDKDKSSVGSQLLGISIIGDDDTLFEFKPAEVLLVNGIGSVKSADKRTDAYLKHVKKGFRFLTLIHPSAVVAKSAVIEEGAQIMAGAILQSSVTVKANAIINTGAILDHDCEIGMHSSVSPGAVLSGNVKVGTGAHIGTGASVIQNIKIGNESLVAAGAVVIADVADRTSVRGVPATKF